MLTADEITSANLKELTVRNTPIKLKKTKIDPLASLYSRSTPTKHAEPRRFAFLKNKGSQSGKRGKQFAEEVSKIFQDYINDYLPCISSLPLHEVFCCDDIKVLEEASEIQSHRQVFEALKQTDTRHDLNILWEGWDESDRMINIPEWFQRFADQKQPGYPEKVSNISQKDKQKMAASFRRSLRAFKFLGLVSDKASRKDHVKHCSRQTFFT